MTEQTVKVPARRLNYSALVLVAIVFVIDIVTVAMGHPVHWYSWTLVAALALGIFANSVSNTLIQRILVISSGALSLVSIYGIVRHW